MAIKLIINKENNNTIRYIQYRDGIEVINKNFTAEFSARENNNLITVFSEKHKINSLPVFYSEIQVNGTIYPTAQETLAELSSFIGSFSKGGANPPTPIPVMNRYIETPANGTVIRSKDLGGAELLIDDFALDFIAVDGNFALATNGRRIIEATSYPKNIKLFGDDFAKNDTFLKLGSFEVDINGKGINIIVNDNYYDGGYDGIKIASGGSALSSYGGYVLVDYSGVTIDSTKNGNHNINLLCDNFNLRDYRGYNIIESNHYYMYFYNQVNFDNYTYFNRPVNFYDYVVFRDRIEVPNSEYSPDQYAQAVFIDSGGSLRAASKADFKAWLNS